MFFRCHGVLRNLYRSGGLGLSTILANSRALSLAEKIVLHNMEKDNVKKDTDTIPIVDLSHHPILEKLDKNRLEQKYVNNLDIEALRDFQSSFMALPLVREILPLKNWNQRVGYEIKQDVDENTTEELEDLFLTWKLLTSMSALDKFDWHDPKIDVFCSKFVNIIPDLSQAQLFAAVQHFSFILAYPSPIPKLFQVIKYNLDVECTERFTKDCKNSSAAKSHGIQAEEARAKYFQCAFFWIIIQEGMSSKTHNFRNLYLQSLVSEFVEPDHVVWLNCCEFVYLMFIAGRLRSMFPLKKKGVPVPPVLLAKMEQFLPDYSLQEAGTIASAIYSCRLIDPNSDITRLFLTSLLKADSLEDSSISSSPSISAICKILTKRSAPERDLISKIFAKYESVIQHLRPHTKLRLISLVKRGCPGEFSSFLSTFVQSISEDLDSLRIKDLDQLLYILHFLDLSEDDPVYQKISLALDTVSMHHPRAGKYFLSCNAFLAKMGVFNDDHLDKIFRAANSLPTQFGCDLSTKEGCFEASIDLVLSFHKPGFSLSQNYLSRHRTQETKRSFFLYENILPTVAMMDCDLEMSDHCQTYNGRRLDPNLRNLFLSFRRLYSVGHNSLHNVITRGVQKDLASIISISHQNFLYPQSLSKDTVFCLDVHSQSVQTLPIPESFLKKLRKGNITKPPIIANGIWVALVVVKVQHFDANKNCLGPATYHNKKLEKLGYKVVIVEPDAYSEALKSKTSREHLRNLVKKVVM